MILIITTTALAFICVSLAIALTICYRKYKRVESNAIDAIMHSVAILMNIKKGIKKFNEKYDVQLRLDRVEGDEKEISLFFTDPKDEPEEQKEQATNNE